MPNTKPSNTTLIYASFSKRLLAIVYDGILLAAILMIAAAIATAVLVFTTGKEEVSSSNPIMIIWLLFVGFLYYGVSWKISGQTLGLRTWRLRLTSSPQEPLSWIRIIIRYLLGLALFVSVIGFFWILIDKKNRSLYDILSQTQIIDEKKSNLKS